MLPQQVTMRAGTVYFPKCGTGWLVNEQHVVTNRHIAQCVRRTFRSWPWVIFPDGSQIFLTRIRWSGEPYVDLAVFELEDPIPAKALPLGDPESLSRDMVVLSVGNPPNSRFQPNHFRVVARPPRVAGGLDGVIVLEGDAEAGESGSPIATLDGKVVGVLFARAPGHAYAVPVRPYLIDLMNADPR